MIAANTIQTNRPERVFVEPVKFRHAAQGNEPTILADIFGPRGSKMRIFF
jgi:hypothetical protein